MKMNETSDAFCGESLYRWQSMYEGIHGYLSLFVCIFGCTTNILNIIVLTRKEMTSATNVILTGLAIADFAVLLEYIPFTCHLYLRPDNHSMRDKYTYGWAIFVLLHSNFSQIFHTISIWLTIALAVWRYIAVAYPERNRIWCKMQNTYLVVAAGYIICPILCIPVYLSFNIVPRIEYLDEYGFRVTNNTITTNTNNVTLYFVNMSDIAKKNNNFLSNVNFLIYSVVFKIIPCIALTVLSLTLVRALIETKKRRQKLLNNFKNKLNSNDKEKQTDRTTRMLLAVLFLFLITEFPQGILGLLTIIFHEQFFIDCYQNLAEVLDILALINSAINFIPYYMMSRQFRTTFKNVFQRKKNTIGNNNLDNLDKQTNNHHHNNATHTQVTQV